jgi:hypothetical protein
MRLLTLIFILAFAVACAGQPAAPRSDFEQVGHFQNGNTFHGLVFFVNAPTKQNIKTLCEQKKVLFASADLLKIHFFDNRQFTPDVTAEYFFPETSDAHLVADCFFNTSNGEQGLNFHKEIPD